MSHSDIEIIKVAIAEFLGKMTMDGFVISADTKEENGVEVVVAQIELQEPKFFIGQNGQTLMELQRLLRIFLNRRLGKSFYLDLDVNGYKKKKIEHLQDLARDMADEAVASQQKKMLPPMSSYERRIIHSELSARKDIITESFGQGADRCVVINPAQ